MIKCILCGRTLKKKESIERGAGDKCYEKIQKQQQNTLEEWVE